MSEFAAQEQKASSTRLRACVVAISVVSLAGLGAVVHAAGDDAGAGGAELRAVAVGSSTTVAVDETVTADSVADLTGVPPGDPPDGLGDDAELDALAQSCYDGDLVACDRLYLQSPVGSDYEAYGDTCAGRRDAGAGTYCGLTHDGTPPTTSGEPTPPEGLGDDPELNALAESCYAGDMEACDDLYAEAAAGSPYEVYGDTCAGRQPEDTGRYCTSLENPVPGGELPDATTADTIVAPDTTAAPDTTVVPETTTPTTDVTESTAPATLPTTEPVPGAIPPPTEDPTALGNDPELNDLAQRCYDGDMQACDDLYNESEPDTPYRTYGDTCAGRQPRRSGVWCAAAFPGDAAVETTPTETTVAPTAPPTTTEPAPPTTEPAPPTTEPVATTTEPVATTTEPVTPTTGPVTTTTEPVATIPTEPVATIPPPTLEPAGLGDDPQLDDLAQQCFDGDMAACDELWRQAEADSAYRNYGDTCAGRQQPNTGTWCEDAFPAGTTPTTDVDVTTTAPLVPTTLPPATTAATGIPPATEEPTGLGEDPVLNDLAEQCYDGDMVACDDLFDGSAVGSAYQAYGDTCAGRQPAGTFNYCRVSFPTSQP